MTAGGNTLKTMTVTVRWKLNIISTLISSLLDIPVMKPQNIVVRKRCYLCPAQSLLLLKEYYNHIYIVVPIVSDSRVCTHVGSMAAVFVLVFFQKCT